MLIARFDYRMLKSFTIKESSSLRRYYNLWPTGNFVYDVSQSNGGKVHNNVAAENFNPEFNICHRGKIY